MPVQACTTYGSIDVFRQDKKKGSVYFTHPDSQHEQFMWYYCPCGCDRLLVITVGRHFKPKENPSWHWNGDAISPTLTPSLNIQDHWHGWLRDGRWVSA